MNIHSDCAGSDFTHHLVRDTKIAGPYAARQAVHGPIGFPCDMIKIVVVKCHGTKHRAENLLANDRHFRPRAGQNRRLDEISLIADAIAAGHDRGAIGLALREIARHPFELLLGGERPHLRALAQCMSDANLPRLARDALDDLFEDALMRIQTRSGSADLTGIVENRSCCSRNGYARIGVRKDDHGRFASQFERYLLEIARSGLDDEPADLARTREGDLVDIRMGRDGGARGWTKPRDDVDHAIGNSRFLDQLPEAERGQRRLLRRLEYDRTARCES